MKVAVLVGGASAEAEVSRSSGAGVAEALASRMVLAHTGQSRDSGINNWEVTKRRIDGDPEVTALFDEICHVARAMRQALEAARWDDAARHLALEWDLRKRLAPGVTTARLEGLIARGRQAGARAAKVCGAGGGGCLLLLVPPDRAAAVRAALAEAGGRVLDCRIDADGVQVAVDRRAGAPSP